MTEPEQRSGPRPRGVVRRLVVIIALLIVAVHMFATFARVAPPNPISAALAGPVSHHMHPLFNQGWAIFAPNPQLEDVRIWVRAAHLHEGDLAATDWFDVSSTFYDQAANQLVPPRHWRMVSPLYRHQHAAHNALTEEQQALLLDEYIGPDARSTLAAALSADGGHDEAVDHYLHSETMLIGFATNVILSLHPDINLYAVQVRTSRQGVIPWSQRNDPHAQRPEEVFRQYGWREPIIARPTSQDAFTSVFQGFLDD